MKIGIVILNYLAYKITMKTVDSFMKQDPVSNEIKIIIVDNCSPNESYEKLCETYAKNSLVKVICTEKILDLQMVIILVIRNFWMRFCHYF